MGMTFENDALNQAIIETNVDRSDPGFAISSSNLFIKHVAMSDSPIEAAKAAGIPDEHVDEYIERMMSDTVVHVAIAQERERTALADKILTIEGISRTLAEMILIGQGRMPNPVLAMSYEVGQAPVGAYEYNAPMVIKAIDTLVKIKELERKGVTFDSAESSGTQAAMREIGRLIHEQD